MLTASAIGIEFRVLSSRAVRQLIHSLSWKIDDRRCLTRGKEEEVCTRRSCVGRRRSFESELRPSETLWDFTRCFFSDTRLSITALWVSSSLWSRLCACARRHATILRLIYIRRSFNGFAITYFTRPVYCESFTRS